MADEADSVRQLCAISARRGLMVDMHCDETDDPMSRHVETLAAETLRLGLGGRVAGSHLTSMHSMDNYHVSKLLPLIAEAGGRLLPTRSSTPSSRAGVVGWPVRHIAPLLGDAAAAVLVQRERQGGYPRSGQGAASYVAPVPGATGPVHATRSHRRGTRCERHWSSRHVSGVDLANLFKLNGPSYRAR